MLLEEIVFFNKFNGFFYVSKTYRMYMFHLLNTIIIKQLILFISIFEKRLIRYVMFGYVATLFQLK